MFRTMVEAITFQAIVETGSYRGTTTKYLRELSGENVYTVESAPRFFHYTSLRFRHDCGVTVACGDSRLFLQRLGSSPEFPHDRVFFYLDAHWGDDLPLHGELQLIGRYWIDPVVLIDDFQVPDDPGYGFDDYGVGRRLSVDYLDPETLRAFDVFWPAIGSAQETGLCRGCVVLARKGVSAERMRQLGVLREAHNGDGRAIQE
jgi:hypothetical protein